VCSKEKVYYTVGHVASVQDIYISILWAKENMKIEIHLSKKEDVNKVALCLLCNSVNCMDLLTFGTRPPQNGCIV
jgi:hypothetical protein